jgi:hypothetical protein
VSFLLLQDARVTEAFSAAYQLEDIKAKLCAICAPENLRAPKNLDRLCEIAIASLSARLSVAGIDSEVDCSRLPFARF